jgi:glyoxalase/bleomycin resistance protein/dioxygenase superfamily protein
MTFLAGAALAATLAAPEAAAAGAPDWYKTVASVHWVVRDLDAVKRAWARLGFPALIDFGDVELPLSVRGQPSGTRLRVALAVMDGLQVYWLQPYDKAGPYAEFLKQRGEGVFSLNHAAPTAAALDAEVARLERLGVPVLQRTDVDTDNGPLRIVHMDTAAEGKYVLGLVYGTPPGSGGAGPAPPFPMKLSQFAFVAKDLKAVSSFWSRLGLPAIAIDRPSPLRDRLYRGQPAAFEQELGWQRHGGVVYEWIRSLAGPTVYDDFAAAHGEGLHHFGFDVEDLDKAVAVWKESGFEAVQSGAWGDAGKPGSGRYAYVDVTGTGGVYLELLAHTR